MKNSYLTIRNRRNRGRLAFTLVELLLVIAIIAVLASMAVGVMAQAQNDAAISATRSRISLIQKILEVELEDYEVRRSPIPFARIGALINASNLENKTERKLMHAKNLKRMIVADLIRTEMPDGSQINRGPNLNQFPSDTFGAYLQTIGVDPTEQAALLGSIPLQGVTRWGIDFPASATDVDADDGFFDDAANRSEILFAILSSIDYDGVPAIEALGGRAVGDSDDDGINEVLDSWGEPIFLQWQQEWITLTPDTSGNPNFNRNEWQRADVNPRTGASAMGGLSTEHSNPAATQDANGNPFPTFSPTDFVKPVLPTQIRPFLVSQRLLEVEGRPEDYLPLHILPGNEKGQR